MNAFLIILSNCGLSNMQILRAKFKWAALFDVAHTIYDDASKCDDI